MDIAWQLWGLLLAMLAEEVGLPFPFLSSGVLLALGFAHHSGGPALWMILVVATIATALGTTILYVLGAYGARPLVMRFGSRWRLTPERQEMLIERLRKNAFVAVFGARFVPGMTPIASLLAGYSRVPLVVVLAAQVSASLLWTVFWLYSGYVGHGPITSLYEMVASQTVPAAIIAVAVIGLILFTSTRRREAEQRKQE